MISATKVVLYIGLMFMTSACGVVDSKPKVFLQNGGDPTSTSTTEVMVAANVGPDQDNDGVNDTIEQLQCKTSITSPDTDGDGLGDKEECLLSNNLCNPLDADTDGDGIGDLEEWQLAHNQEAGQPSCKEDDHDNDGDPFISDCDDFDPKRFHGNVETDDGVDENCEIDRVSCIADDLSTVPLGCQLAGFNLGFDIWDSCMEGNGMTKNYENSYCVRASIEAGIGKDPYIDGNIVVDVRRYKSAATSCGGETHVLAYEDSQNNLAGGLQAEDQAACGPQFLSGGMSMQTAISPASSFSTEAVESALCEFPLLYNGSSGGKAFSDSNYTKVKRLPGTHRFEVELRHHKLHVGQSGAGLPHWHQTQSNGQSEFAAITNISCSMGEK